MTNSWIDVHPDSHFSLDNIPFGIASHAGEGRAQRFGATRIGDSVVDLGALEACGLFADVLPTGGDTFFDKVSLDSMRKTQHAAALTDAYID